MKGERPTMIRHILFDLGKVLVPFDRQRSYARLIPRLSPEKRRFVTENREDFEALVKEPAIALETGRIDLKRFQARIEQTLDVSLNRDEFRRIWCDIFWMDEKTVGLGEALSEWYGTWLVSNTSKAHYEWIIEKFPRVAFYRDAALSYRLGVMKPAKDYYVKALRQFGIQASQAVFIDDRQDNVDGALAAGMRGIVFENYAQLVEDLKKLGIDAPGEIGGDR